jgi:hypothetical protein
MSRPDLFRNRVLNLFGAEGDHLLWTRLADDHVVGGESGLIIKSGEAYFTVRLTEMFLGRSRTLWRKFYPVVHAFSAHAGSEEHAVAGPGQLQAVTDAGLDRVISLNFRLAGPTPFRGGDMSIVAGLYSVPGDDAAKALVETVSALAGLAMIPASQVAPVAQVIKTGIDGVFRLGTTKLRLGVNDTFIASNPLRSGFHVGIAAPETEIDLDRLWLRDGRLITGKDPIAGTAFTGHDYMVIQLERSERLSNWPALPGMSELQQRFNSVLADELLSADDKRNRLGVLWPAFRETLVNSPYLTFSDALRIQNDVKNDLKARLDAQQTGNPFETKAWGSDSTVVRSPAAIDFAEVSEIEINGPLNPFTVQGRDF